MAGIETIRLFRKGAIMLLPCTVSVVPSGFLISNVLPAITCLLALSRLRFVFVVKLFFGPR